MKENNTKYIHLDCEDMFNDVDKLLHLIKNTQKKFDCILCVGRGGMFLSRLLSEYLNISDIIYYPVYSYVEGSEKGIQNSQSVPKLRHNFDYGILKNKTVLIVDDKYDTGITINFIYDEIKMNNVNCDHTTSVWYVNKEANLPQNIIYAKTCSSDEWIIFPWEEH